MNQCGYVDEDCYRHWCLLRFSTSTIHPGHTLIGGCFCTRRYWAPYRYRTIDRWVECCLDGQACRRSERNSGPYIQDRLLSYHNGGCHRRRVCKRSFCAFCGQVWFSLFYPPRNVELTHFMYTIGRIDLLFNARSTSITSPVIPDFDTVCRTQESPPKVFRSRSFP